MEITKEAYSEVYAILNLMSWSSISKIPEKIWENIDNKRDKDKIIEINNIEEYQASEQANKLLAVLYKDFFSKFSSSATLFTTNLGISSFISPAVSINLV